LKKQNPL